MIRIFDLAQIFKLDARPDATLPIYLSLGPTLARGLHGWVSLEYLNEGFN